MGFLDGERANLARFVFVYPAAADVHVDWARAVAVYDEVLADVDRGDLENAEDSVHHALAIAAPTVIRIQCLELLAAIVAEDTSGLEAGRLMGAALSDRDRTGYRLDPADRDGRLRRSMSVQRRSNSRRGQRRNCRRSCVPPPATRG